MMVRQTTPHKGSKPDNLHLLFDECWIVIVSGLVPALFEIFLQRLYRSSIYSITNIQGEFSSINDVSIWT
ncbi:hypothetical protein CesoFtcFv8_005790 [Champsocephalus esox]|uniref:Uncharacterized protein n=1 Tax=Champsocephalus esox TaxID=159716 RepID=A0AAN8CIH3_9TELE|nr:hypothetical protein CesoFtcFv8_005790 [Champsocephalus esox]